ncbi:MAG: aminotransferase class I/II-fold pyridoxal phosphate-dependent enzyme [Candidatus Altiarchaeales archaeon]|nr:aminotransferase class I/II-fold pyridoxal phosphate-dependent enzyme [Candidatus Altiarchaeales archaeon]MBD3416032.1 aminotransferase class I/II-fold pyridoxal phosphate-dependent enzyme [Candidatus Altiarchaeales archaeon]
MVSKRVSEIPFSGIRRFFDIVSERDDVVSLGVGEPDFPTPDPMKHAGIQSIEDDLNSYTSNYGLSELREKISAKLKSENGLSADPKSQLLITTGTSEALDLVFRAILDPGDEVIVPEPSYVSYKPCVWFAHSTPVPVPMVEDNEFRVQSDDIREKITDRTKAIIVASPNNPTGSVLRKKDLESIADLALEHDLMVVSDELYEDLIYDGLRHYSIGSFNGMSDNTVTINGFSKGYAFTGWRLGYAAGSSEIIEAMMKIHQYTMLSAPSVAQYSALAFDKCGKFVKSMVKEYDVRRRLLVKGLNEVDGVSCIMPKGAFYAFPNIEGTGLSSEEFARKMLDEKKVAVVPGNSFGETGEGHVRCSYSVNRETIKEALERMKA